MQTPLQIYLKFLRDMSYTRIIYDENREYFRLENNSRFYFKFCILQCVLFWSTWYSILEWEVMYDRNFNLWIDCFVHLTVAAETFTMILQFLWSLLQQHRHLNLFRRLQRLSKDCGVLSVPRRMLWCWQGFCVMYSLNAVYQYGSLIFIGLGFLRLLMCSILHCFYANYLITFYAALLNLMAQILSKHQEVLELAFNEGASQTELKSLIYRNIQVHDEMLALGEQHVNIIYGPLIICQLTYACLAIPCSLYYSSQHFSFAPFPWIVTIGYYAALPLTCNSLNEEVSKF